MAATPASPTPAAGTATVRFAYRASTAPRPDLPPSTRDCVQGVGRTHIHPSWRGFDRVDMTPVGTDRWEIAFSDVPVNARQGRVAARPAKPVLAGRSAFADRPA